MFFGDLRHFERARYWNQFCCDLMFFGDLRH